MKGLLKQLYELLTLLGLVILLFASGRIILFFTHKTSFSNFSTLELFAAFYKGLEYDFWIVMLLNLIFLFLFLWPAKIYNSIFYLSLLKVLFFTSNSLALLVNLWDVRVYTLRGQRLRADMFKEEISRFFHEFSSSGPNDLINNYLSLSFFFIAFMLVLWFGFRQIKRRELEYRKFRIARRLICLFAISFLIGYFSFSIPGSQEWIPGVYLKTDRRLAPLVINNPYLLIRSANSEYISNKTDWDFENFKSQKKYAPINAKVPQHIKVVLIENTAGKINDLDSTLLTSNFKYFPLGNLRSNNKNIFHILDELLLSFPSIFEHNFYQSIYSLNQFENLVSLLQKNGYSTIVSCYGYDDKTVKLIKHFYGFRNHNEWSQSNSKTFELVLLKGIAGFETGSQKLFDDSSAVDSKENILVITAIINKKQKDTKLAELSKSIKLFSSFSLPFYKASDSIITQYLDIKPSLLHLIGYTEPFIAYGSSLFSSEEKTIFQCESDNLFKLMSDSLIVIQAEGETLSLNILKKRKFSIEDFKDSLAVERIILENKLHSILYDYRLRLLSNTLR